MILIIKKSLSFSNYVKAQEQEHYIPLSSGTGNNRLVFMEDPGDILLSYLQWSSRNSVIFCPLELLPI